MLSDSTIDKLTGQCHLLWWFPLVSRGGGGACLCVCAPLCLLTLLVSPVPFNPDASHFHHNCAGSRLVTQITSALCERFSRSTWHTYRRPDGWPFTGTLTHAPNCEPVTVRTLSRHARNAGQITLGGSETSVACPQEQAAKGRVCVTGQARRRYPRWAAWWALCIHSPCRLWMDITTTQNTFRTHILYYNSYVLFLTQAEKQDREVSFIQKNGL